MNDLMTASLNVLRESSQIRMWLDDLRPMPSRFNYHAKTADEAIKMLKSGKVIEVSLDHDLGPPEAGTGDDVAKWIEQSAFHGKLKQLDWNIHSANPVGVQNMKAALTSADRFWSSH